MPMTSAQLHALRVIDEAEAGASALGLRSDRKLNTVHANAARALERAGFVEVFAGPDGSYARRINPWPPIDTSESETQPETPEERTEEVTHLSHGRRVTGPPGSPTVQVDKAPQDPKPIAPPAPARGPLDPITKPLWRLQRPDRLRLLDPFLGKDIRVDRWFGRVASHGDEQYEGTLLAVARTTTGSTADFLVLQTKAGVVWAISTAQVAFIELLAKPRKVAR